MEREGDYAPACPIREEKKRKKSLLPLVSSIHHGINDPMIPLHIGVRVSPPALPLRISQLSEGEGEEPGGSGLVFVGRLSIVPREKGEVRAGGGVGWACESVKFVSDQRALRQPIALCLINQIPISSPTFDPRREDPSNEEVDEYLSAGPFEIPNRFHHRILIDRQTVG